MLFCSSRIRLLITNLNVVTQWCAEQIYRHYCTQYTSNKNHINQSVNYQIQHKEEAQKMLVFTQKSVFWTAQSQKKFQGFPQTFPKFQQNPRTIQDVPGFSRTGGNYDILYILYSEYKIYSILHTYINMNASKGSVSVLTGCLFSIILFTPVEKITFCYAPTDY